MPKAPTATVNRKATQEAVPVKEIVVKPEPNAVEVMRIANEIKGIEKQIRAALRQEGHTTKALKLLVDQLDRAETRFYSLPVVSFRPGEAAAIQALIEKIRAITTDGGRHRTIFNPNILSSLTVDSSSNGD